MYHILYPQDTPENRKEFLNSWSTTYCLKQSEINYNISAKTIALNFSRCYFHLEEKELIFAFIAAGFISKVKDDAVYFNISNKSSSLKEFKTGWN